MLRVAVSTLPALRPLIRRRPLLNPKPPTRSRLPQRTFRALSSSAPHATAAPSAAGAGEAVEVEEHLTRCAAAGRAPLRVAVLVSGGVDSSVALRLLHAAGHRCTAFYLKIWFQEDFRNFWSECPWDEDLKYAQAVCDKIDVPLEVVHLSDEYWNHVVSHIINEYRCGRTPNPDVLCNTRIKFGAFLEAIENLGFDYIASGHYARVVHPSVENTNAPSLLQLSKDKIKDQTYFLSHLSQSQLRRLLFPLGCIKKDEVRRLAAQMGLPNQGRKDSQGICFLGKVKFSEFVERHIGKMEGIILEAESGDYLGNHRGFWFYTIGQRQGLRLAGGPWYVVEKDVQNNVVFVSRNYYSLDKRRRTFRVGSLNWFDDSGPGNSERLKCKVRHSPEFHDCTVTIEHTEENGDVLVVRLSEDDQGLAAETSLQPSIANCLPLVALQPFHSQEISDAIIPDNFVHGSDDSSGNGPRALSLALLNNAVDCLDETTPQPADATSVPLIALQPFVSPESPDRFISGSVYLGYGSDQPHGIGTRDLSMDLSQNPTDNINEFQVQQQPGSPEFTLYRPVSEKFSIHKLFTSLGICNGENSNNMVPVGSLVEEPVTNDTSAASIGICPGKSSTIMAPEESFFLEAVNNDAAAGGHETPLLVDNFTSVEEGNFPLDPEVVDIGSEDTHGSIHEQPDGSDLSQNNMQPDLEITEELPAKVVHSHSNFDLHPNDLGFYHYLPPPKKAKELYEAYEKGLVSLSRYQFIHRVPYEIKFTGTTLWEQLMRGGAFDVPMCDAIMRLFKSLDDRMYEPRHNRWRHFLPATFADIVLNGGYYIGDKRIRSSFIGNHISYNVEDCCMIVVPVVFEGRCSCYFWDFETMRIHVLDPLMMRCTPNSVQQRHGKNVTILNEAISRCKDTFFQGWNVSMNGWDRCFTVGLGVSCHRNNSGLFATHYARAFDGFQLLWELKTPEHALNRADLLYQLLSMAGNCGHVPDLLIDLLEI